MAEASCAGASVIRGLPLAERDEGAVKHRHSLDNSTITNVIIVLIIEIANDCPEVRGATRAAVPGIIIPLLQHTR